jgi:transglutaminase-like putative cysteine protease
MRLIILRGILYFLTLVILLIDPAIFVVFDRLGVGLYFFLIPLSAILSLVKGKNKYYLEGIFLILYMLAFPGFSREGILAVIVGLYVFFTTSLVIERNILFFLKGEMFFLAALHYRMLLFTYSSSELVMEYKGFGSFLFFFLLLSFFLYGGAIFLYQSRAFRERKGDFILLGGGALLVIAIAFLLSTDGVSHSIIRETANDPIKSRPEMMDLTTNSPFDEGNLKGDNRGEGLDQSGNSPGQEGEDGGPRLLGIPGDSWQEGEMGQAEGSPARQYAVMVVESERESTYLASHYFTHLDRDLGFTSVGENYLNDIAHMRFLESWRNPHTPLFTGREAVSVSVLSVESEKGVPYYPYTVEPTVNDRTYYPFIYSWKSLSLITTPNSFSSLNSIRSYPAELPSDAADALDVDLPESMIVLLDKLLENLGTQGMGPYKTLEAILDMYSTYQYTLGFTEDWSTDHIMDFLISGKEGDCTEFSNGTALLARRAGIPTRVVTGYLASEGLQTPNHRQAIQYLWEQIPSLQDKNPSNLYLVTSSHRHAWVQCWFPRYGWIDFETTAQALPPSGSGDPNSLDLVIPVITETVKGKSSFIFPWRLLLRIVSAGVVILLFTAYLSKSVFKAILRKKGRHPGEVGCKSLYRLMEIRWIDRGHLPRDKQTTPREYGESCPDIKDFSESFIRAVYGNESDEVSWTQLRKEYSEVFKKDRSLMRGMREVISLKGLYYGIQSR